MKGVRSSKSGNPSREYPGIYQLARIVFNRIENWEEMSNKHSPSVILPNQKRMARS